MFKWLPVVAILVGLVGVAERFYARFYPDAETQKRHLKLVGVVVLNIVATAAQIWALWDIFHRPMPTRTPQLVLLIVEVGFYVSILCTLALFAFMDNVISQIIDLFKGQNQIIKGQMNISKEVIELIRLHNNALRIVSTIVEPEVRAALIKILDEVETV
jgi:hypothetical protein